MQPTLCSKCKKNVAVVFISRMNEKNEMVNEGLCLKCAAQLGLPQVEDMMKRMGITPEDLENKRYYTIRFSERQQKFFEKSEKRTSQMRKAVV